MTAPKTLRARWLLPITSKPIRDGALIIEDGIITAVLTAADLEEADPSLLENADNYGDAIICPGLINLHSHLDYSSLHLFDVHSPLFDWICRLVTESSKWSADQWSQSALAGARQSALHGVTCLVDSSFTGSSLPAMARVGLRGLVGLELFGLKEEDAPGIWQHWLQRLANLRAGLDSNATACLENGQIKLTVSPHAPYTVSPALWKMAQTWSDQHGLPLLAHLGESIQERQWLMEGNQTIDRYLTDVLKVRNPSLATTPDGISEDVNDIKWNRRGLSPVRHLEHFELLRKNLIAAHAVHLDSEEFELLAQAGVSIVHCPRSNARLGNGRAPLESFRTAGIAFGMGTDSLASCDNLDIIDECNFAADLHRCARPEYQISSEDLIRLITIESAHILGMGAQIGSLEPGKFADISVFRVGSDSITSEKPLDLLIHGRRKLQDLFVQGLTVVKDGILQEKNPRSAS